MVTGRPSRGEIWFVELDPTRGHEQASRRPALVISVDLFNHGAAGLIVALPITSKAKGNPSHVAVKPPDGGLRRISYIKCEGVRSVSVERLTDRCGTLSALTLEAVEDRLRILLGL